MPLVRIDMNRGRSREEIKAVTDAVHQSLVEVFKIPERDRFQLVTQHDADEIIAQDAGLGFERTPGAVMIQIFTQHGRSTEDKQHLPSAARRPCASGRRRPRPRPTRSSL
ncbi:tautomerase family protein [Streptomyces sp. NPDC102360]|uniref:tautomerase family protein n=1 Tax=Streptomyces sp. NPDC102360 TaxID=3366160 RepID=UPI0037FF131E